MMRIAIDYDFTFSEDPEGWSLAMLALKQRGHDVVGVTARHPNHVGDMLPSYFDLCSQVHFTAGEFKRKYMTNEGVIIHVWIDDAPEAIAEPYPIIGQK